MPFSWSAPFVSCRALELCHLSLHVADRQHHAQGIRGEGGEAIAGVEVAALGSAGGISAIENVEQDDADADQVRRPGDAAEAIDEKVSAIALALVATVNADHRDIGCRYGAVAGSVAGKAFGQVGIVHGMGIGGVEADHLALWAGHNENADVAGLRELVGGLAEVVVDLFDAAGEGGAVMACRIERFDNAARARR